MDIELPGIDGLTVTRMLKSDPKTSSVPVVALTANAMKGNEQEALAAGCSGYISKADRGGELRAEDRHVPGDRSLMTGAGKTILIVEDDAPSREVVRLACSAQNHTLLEAANGVDGLAAAREQNPDLIILDINLPGMSGLDVCRRLRSEGSRVPIIMLTAKADTIDVVVGLELGADDYVTKPFEVRELMARIGAHLRRSEISSQEQPRDRFEFPGLTIDLGRRQAFRDSEEVMLTLTEFNLLALLASRPGQVMSRGELLRRVWGYEVEIETRTVDAHVYRLRRKIEPDAEKPTYIHSVPGIGYRFSG